MESVFGLAGKKALVIGGGLGIGRASARILATQGVDVAVVDLDRERAETVARDLRDQGHRSCSIVADVTHSEEAERAVKSAASELGGLDILVNIVGRNGMRVGLADLQADQFELLLSNNLRHHVYVSGAFARELRSRGSGGAVVMVASMAGILGAPGLGGYAAAKAALMSLTRSMAVEWGPLGIRVNSVAPGVTWTDRNQWGEDVRERARRTVPLRRIGHQDEIARAALFLASDLASYVTGETLVADGGLTLLSAFDGYPGMSE